MAEGVSTVRKGPLVTRGSEGLSGLRAAGGGAPDEAQDDADDLPEDGEGASGKATPSASAGKTPAPQKNGKPDAKTEPDPKTELERVNAELKTATEKRIPDLQRRADTAEGKVKDLDRQLKERDATWWNWAKEVLTKEQLEELRKRYSQQAAAETTTKAGETDALTVIAEVLEEDPEFAKFLRRRHKTGNKISRDNLEAWREEFKELAPKAASGDENDEPKPKPTEKKRPAARVAGAGGPTRSGGPAWRPGQTASSLITRGFREREGR